MSDALSNVAFARERGEAASFPHQVCAYERPLVCSPGQEEQVAAKRRNVELALSQIDRLIIERGEMFSFWRCVGEPGRKAGYEQAAALKDRVLTQEVGGALCLASTLLYNVGLLAGLDIVERRCHSVDTYGNARYFELGRDAAVEYAYIDLRFKNPYDARLLLRCAAADNSVEASVWSPVSLALAVEISVSPGEHDSPPVVRRLDPALPPGTEVVEFPGAAGVAVQTTRRIVMDGLIREEDLGWTVHHAAARLERYCPANLRGTLSNDARHKEDHL